ncbi:MAG: hypothetical protein QW358_01295 [Candidatus Hadarchaeum sp.]
MSVLNLTALLFQIIASVIILSPVLWISGRSLAGKEKAKFTDAVWIVALGTIIGGIVGAVLSGVLGSVIMLIIWLALVKHFFDCGWLMALAVSIISVIIFVIIAIVLGIVGLALWSLI